MKAKDSLKNKFDKWWGAGYGLLDENCVFCEGQSATKRIAWRAFKRGFNYCKDCKSKIGG